MTLNLWAGDDANSFTLDLPASDTEVMPAWLGHPLLPAGTFATLDLPMVPPNSAASLLVTVFFQEKEGGFLRISWENGTDAQVLSGNFYEGIGMANQRSLLITPDTMKQSGTLQFQTGATVLGISRLEFEWLDNQTGLVSPTITETLVTPRLGMTKPASELDGEPPQVDSAAWHDRIVNVPVTDAPLRIEQGVDFSVQMEGVPAMARLTLKESGLPWGQHLVVWIGGTRAGTIEPSVPELGDGGYGLAAISTAYVGWRPGTLFVPVSTLTSGVNTLQFSAEADGATGDETNGSTPALLAVKDVALQLDYPAAKAATVVPTLSPAPVVASDTSSVSPDSSAVSLPDPGVISSTVPAKATQGGLLALP